MRRLSYITGCIVFVLCLMIPMGVPAQNGEGSKVIEADGAGVVINNDLALARDNAINDSLRKAVEQAVGTVISSETVVQNYEVINDSIYAKSQGYIQNYQILNEKVSDGLYRVTIRATVSMGGIKDDLRALGFLMAQKNMPR
ncbi:MAG: flagellar assembly protein T N-terminal domain-containing protein, partial [Deltaproteobacteria bacterium]|nr:flagellar assembly protein T N-terminal domain-containing protein [Deltaproteobacteria bacterium]